MRGLPSLLLVWLSSILSAEDASGRAFVKFRPTLTGVAQVPPAPKPADKVWTKAVVRETLVPSGKKPDETQREILSTLPLKLKRRSVAAKPKSAPEPSRPQP
jgi:hypothetical protein